jgi:hypothetical protein
MENTDRNFRLAIYPKDVAIITGKSLRSAGRLVLKIRTDLKKGSHQILTIGDFCNYMGLDTKEILIKLNL